MGFNMGSNSMQGLNPSRVSKQPARCQVEGCSVDLSGSKAYYARHKVCGIHSKSPMVVVGGIHQRFCQQCSRFHQLVEFDEGKRSCRRRLAGHNERRRKPPSSSLTSQIRLHSSPFPGDNSLKLRGFLMDFTCPHPSLRDSWIGGAGANSDGSRALSLLSAQFLWGNSLNRNSLPPRPHVTATGTTTSTTSLSSDNGYCGAPIVASDVSSTSNSKSGLSSFTEPAWLSNELELGGLQRKRQCVELDGVFRSNLKH